MSTKNLLMWADSERDANLLYAVGMFVPDPFIYLRIGKKSYLVLNDLEVDRARRLAPHCRILSLRQCRREMQRNGETRLDCAQVIAHLLRQHRVRKLAVPSNFPFGLARELKKLKLKLQTEAELFPQRAIKKAEEVKKISAALTMAEVGLAEGIQALRLSKPARDGKLLYHNVPLTSEKLRGIIDTAVLQAGGLPQRTIVAGGSQACDPHEPGHGPLRANQPIVIDIFPRSQKTGYFGDITRTVVKGRASEAVRKLYTTVEQAQELGLKALRKGVVTGEIHEAIQKFFVREGYKTGKVGGRMQGFFHGTGHGVGLDIHEAPRIGQDSRDILCTGHVVTVEPGLYYLKTGGVRLEDMALVTSNGPRNLTKFEKVLEI